jgi:hypothetical protein
MDIIDKLVNKYLKQYFWCEVEATPIVLLNT